MIVETFEDTPEGKESWLRSRRGRITGSKVNDVMPKKYGGKKIGFYELIAERVGIPGDLEEPRNRGNRLEGEAMGFFEEEMHVEITCDKVLWCREDNLNIAVSPDGVIDRETAVEVKCLSSALHLQAFFEQETPKEEYYLQALQYFIVNEDLQTLYLVFYDPRILVKPLHYLTLTRDELEEDIAKYYQAEVNIIKEVKAMANKLSF